jgi:hypothetical protein
MVYDFEKCRLFPFFGKEFQVKEIYVETHKTKAPNRRDPVEN